jgi:hypothetical protein
MGIIAIVVSILVGGLGFCLGMLADSFAERKWAIAASKFLIVVLTVGGLAGGWLVMTEYDYVEREKFIATFSAQKITCEAAMESENITPIERAAIVTRIMEQNSELAEEKVSIVRWYNFHLSNEVKQRVLDLEPIDVN